MSKHRIELRPFLTPNFVLPVGEFATSISIKDVETTTLGAMCDEWRASVFAKAGKVDPNAALRAKVDRMTKAAKSYIDLLDKYVYVCSVYQTDEQADEVSTAYDEIKAALSEGGGT